MKNKIKEFYKLNDNKINGMKFKKWLNDNSDIKIYLEKELNNHLNLVNITNIAYCIANDILLDNFICKTCGKQLVIKKITQPVNYCSVKCAMNNVELQKNKSETISKDPEFWKKRQEKIVKTNLKRYGTKTPAENKNIVEKMKKTCANDLEHWKKRNEKSKQTCLEKYGVENVSSTKEVREKVKNTFLKNYGIDNPNKLDIVKEKIKKTNLEKYGVDCQFKRKEIIEKNLLKSWNTINRWKDFVEPLFTFDEYSGYSKNQIYKWKCVKCGNEFEQQLYHTKIFTISTRVPRCLNCYPVAVNSFKEIELKNFCKQYYPNLIENDRQLIKPYELDIVIPELKLAIEFNGTYWHSDNIKNDINYHLNKTIECEKRRI